MCLPSAAPGSGLCIGSKITLTAHHSSPTGFQVFASPFPHTVKTKITRTQRMTTSSICNLTAQRYPTIELTYISQSLWYVTNYADIFTTNSTSTYTEDAAICFVTE
jgi:hypothetical protein